MKKIDVWVTTGKIGSKCSTVIEVEDDCPDDVIEELARDAMFSLITWSWTAQGDWRE